MVGISLEWMLDSRQLTSFACLFRWTKKCLETLIPEKVIKILNYLVLNKSYLMKEEYRILVLGN